MTKRGYMRRKEERRKARERRKKVERRNKRAHPTSKEDRGRLLPARRRRLVGEISALFPPSSPIPTRGGGQALQKQTRLNRGLDSPEMRVCVYRTPRTRLLSQTQDGGRFRNGDEDLTG